MRYSNNPAASRTLAWAAFLTLGLSSHVALAEVIRPDPPPAQYIKIRDDSGQCQAFVEFLQSAQPPGHVGTFSLRLDSQRRWLMVGGGHALTTSYTILLQPRDPPEYTTCSEDIWNEKSQAYIDYYRQQVRDMEFLGSALHLLELAQVQSWLAAMIFAIEQLGNTYVGPAFGTGVGLAIQYVGAQPLTIPIAIALAMTYAELKIEGNKLAAQGKANDPPDANFHEVFEYSNATVEFTHFDEELNAYFEDGFARISRALESSQGELVSTERAQGAMIAGDDDAAEMQLQAAARFADDYAVARVPAGEWIAELPRYLRSRGFDSTVSGTTELYEWLGQVASMFGAEAAGSPASLTGFFPPVDSPDVATNLLKAGQTVPLKFHAASDDNAIFSLENVNFAIEAIPCEQAGVVLDTVESFSTATNGVLQNLGGGFYQFNWKTPKGAVGCKSVTLTLPDNFEAEPLEATFKFK